MIRIPLADASLAELSFVEAILETCAEGIPRARGLFLPLLRAVRAEAWLRRAGADGPEEPAEVEVEASPAALFVCGDALLRWGMDLGGDATGSGRVLLAAGRGARAEYQRVSDRSKSGNG